MLREIRLLKHTSFMMYIKADRRQQKIRSQFGHRIARKNQSLQYILTMQTLDMFEKYLLS